MGRLRRAAVARDDGCRSFVTGDASSSTTNSKHIAPHVAWRKKNTHCPRPLFVAGAFLFCADASPQPGQLSALEAGPQGSGAAGPEAGHGSACNSAQAACNLLPPGVSATTVGHQLVPMWARPPMTFRKAGLHDSYVPPRPGGEQFWALKPPAGRIPIFLSLHQWARTGQVWASLSRAAIGTRSDWRGRETLSPTDPASTGMVSDAAARSAWGLVRFKLS